MTFLCDMVDMEMVHMDMVDMDMVGMDMVDMDMVDHLANLSRLLGLVFKVLSKLGRYPVGNPL